MEVFIWVALSIAVGLFAKRRGRSGLAWACIAGFVSPLVAIIILLFLGEGSRRIRCPFCAEYIKPDTRVCPHCKNDLEWSWSKVGDGERASAP